VLTPSYADSLSHFGLDAVDPFGSREKHKMGCIVTSRATQISAWIFVIIAAIVGLQGLLDGLPRHGVDDSWPAHARFHVTQGALSQLGFCLVAAIIALIPFRRGDRWSWWALFVFALLGCFSLFPAAMVQGSGPQEKFIPLIAVVHLALVVALGLSWKIGIKGATS
jgi:hypothetical protein